MDTKPNTVPAFLRLDAELLRAMKNEALRQGYVKGERMEWTDLARETLTTKYGGLTTRTTKGTNNE